jgi:hypothetical protein
LLRYVRNDEEVRKYFAAMHFNPNLPRAVIIDDFVDLFGDRYIHIVFKIVFRLFDVVQKIAIM